MMFVFMVNQSYKKSSLNERNSVNKSDEDNGETSFSAIKKAIKNRKDF